MREHLEGERTREPQARRPGRGFTLIEVLLVLVIVGITTAILLPSFGRSVRGNRLRAAARTVVMAGRYARSMAVLNQREMLVHFDLGQGRVAVCTAARTEAPEPEDPVGQEFYEDWDVLEERPETNTVYAVGAEELSRKLDGIRIAFVEVDEDREVSEGLCMILYRSNGRCTPYRVRLVDDNDEVITVEVDALSSARTERP